MLHPAAVGAEALSAVRQLALPIIIVALLGGGGGAGGTLDRLLFLGAIGAVMSLVIAFVQWQATRWWLESDSVRLRRGVLTENVTTVSFERVQGIDVVRGPIQRVFGVVELHVQSAGGGRAGEIVLKAITTDEAEELRTAVRRGEAGRPRAAVGEVSDDAPERVLTPAAARPQREEDEEEDVRAVWHLGARALLVAAVTSGSLGVIVPILVALSQVGDDLLGLEEARRLAPETAGEVALYAAVILGAAWVLSVLGTIVAFVGFTATREGDRLRISRGLIERRETSVPVARVHAVRVVENPLREPLGVAQVRIETAGYAGEPATAQTLVPLVRRRHATTIIAELLPELATSVGELEAPPTRALRRYVLAPAVVAAAVAAWLAVTFGTPGLIGLVLVPLAGAHGVARYRTAGWQLRGDRMVLRGRGLVRTTAMADPRRLQTVRTTANPFQRRGHLATLSIDVSSGRTFGVSHIDAATAERVWRVLGWRATQGVSEKADRPVDPASSPD
jgi:putative membrane protein